MWHVIDTLDKHKVWFVIFSFDPRYIRRFAVLGLPSCQCFKDAALFQTNWSPLKRWRSISSSNRWGRSGTSWLDDEAIYFTAPEGVVSFLAGSRWQQWEMMNRSMASSEFLDVKRHVFPCSADWLKAVARHWHCTEGTAMCKEVEFGSQVTFELV